MNPDDPDRPHASIWITAAALGVGSLVGGLSGRHDAMSTVWMNGGVPVTLSRLGEAFFFVIGAVAGLAATGLALVLAGSRLSRPLRGAAAVFISGIVGLVVAPIILAALGFLFFTIPDDFFQLLTD